MVLRRVLKGHVGSLRGHGLGVSQLRRGATIGFPALYNSGPETLDAQVPETPPGLHHSSRLTPSEGSGERPPRTYPPIFKSQGSDLFWFRGPSTGIQPPVEFYYRDTGLGNSVEPGQDRQFFRMSPGAPRIFDGPGESMRKTRWECAASQDKDGSTLARAGAPLGKRFTRNGLLGYPQAP